MAKTTSVNVVFITVVVLSSTFFYSVTSQRSFTVSRKHLGLNIDEPVRKWMTLRFPRKMIQNNTFDMDPNVDFINGDFLEIYSKFSNIEFSISGSIFTGRTKEENEYDFHLLPHTLAKFNSEKVRLTATILFYMNRSPRNDSTQISNIENAIRMAHIANTNTPGTVTTLQLNDQSENPLPEIYNNLKVTRDNIVARRMDVNLALLTLDSGKICQNNSEGREEQAKIIDLIDEISVMTEWDCDDLQDENEQRAFRQTIQAVDDCLSSIKIANSKILKVKVSSLCYFSKVNMSKVMNYWWLMSEYAKDTSRTVIMLEMFDPIVTEILFNPLWKSTPNGSSNERIERTKRNDEDKTRGYLAMTMVGIVITVLVIGLIVQCRSNKKIKKMFRGLTQNEIQDFLNGRQKKEGDTNTLFWDSIAYDLDLEMSQDIFFVDKEIVYGSGNFGCVFGGRLHGANHEVAFKTVSDIADSHAALRSMLSEIKVLAYLGKHDHIVNILGAYTAELEKGIIYIAMELCSRGSLDKYLRSLTNSNRRNKDYLELEDVKVLGSRSTLGSQPDSSTGNFRTLQLRLSFEICSAMEYIASKKVVHADLATRNILLTSDLKIKIADFGISRRTYEYVNYVKKKQEPLPWKWMSPEALKLLEFSERSDVWAYAVVLWEIFTLGESPYAGLSWHVDFVQDLQNGLRLQRPDGCPEMLYFLMRSCWEFKKERRPCFAELIYALLPILQV